MEKIITLFIGIFICLNSFSQITPPYYNNFNNSLDTVGWSHYALVGTDDWEFGMPYGYILNSALSQSCVWGTNLDGDFTDDSEMCLESPSFDFSDTTKSYLFGFAHEMDLASYHGTNIQYSIDNGLTWIILNGSYNVNNNWYNNLACAGVNNEPTWSYGSYNHYNFSYHSLDTLKGYPAVKFRFKLGGSSNSKKGWVIDNFSITESGPNIYGIQSDTIVVNNKCDTFNVELTMVFAGINTTRILNKVNYYWSNDTIFDLGDSLIGTKVHYLGKSGINGFNIETINKYFDLPTDLPAGLNYIFYKADCDSLLSESNEIDNLRMAVIKIDSIYNQPLITNFDNGLKSWDCKGVEWQLGQGNKHHFEGSHSGEYSLFNFSNLYRSIESPFVNVSAEDSTLISFWYKTKISHATYNSIPIQYNLGCEDGFIDFSDFPVMRDNTWDYYNVYLPVEADTAEYVSIKINFKNDIIIDDIYIGKAKADLSIECDKENRFTPSSSSIDSITYYFNNGGFIDAGITVSSFYWSTDSIFDASDVLLGNKTEASIVGTVRELRTFKYAKPTSANGLFYIIYILDDGNAVDEMREYNNEGFLKMYQENINSIPYYNDFENQVDGWRHNSTIGLDEWQWTSPKGNLLDTAFSGTKTWITNDTGFVSPMSRMHLYTPIYDLSLSSNPVIEFDMKLFSNYDDGKMNMSFSIDGGATWHVLDTTSQSYNRWYYPMVYQNGIDKVYSVANVSEILFGLTEPAFASSGHYNSRDVLRNTRYILDISFLAGMPQIQFRFNLGTLNNNNLNYHYPVEGVLIDNFSVREAFIDLNINYKKALMQSSNALETKFFVKIMNQGNYISAPSITKFYVSADTILDGSDFALGQVNIPSIRPDMLFYINEAFNNPNNLSAYKYLLYELDASNTNLESNETNNIRYWPLALDSINNYPYYNNFNESIIDGWHQYSINSYNNSKTNYRMRNFVAVKDNSCQSNITSGYWFIENLQRGNNSYNPYFYLQSPSFNFKEIDSISLSFDLICTGESAPYYKDGGNLHFSTDGGNTWSLLTYSYGQCHNWYNHPILNYMNDEAGWSIVHPSPSVVLFDSTSFDATFLKGEENVVFRFKYKSNWGYYSSNVKGLRVDNFMIKGFSLDYKANEVMTPVNAVFAQPKFSVDYSITNSGQINGTTTSTKFYWSNDSILDSNDSLVKIITESPIASGDTSNVSTLITYPTPITQTNYYLFYVTDADSNIVETNEVNNIGSFKIIFDTHISIRDIAAAGLSIYPNPSTGKFTIEKPTALNKEVRVKLLDATSKLILERIIPAGKNKIELDITNYSNGIYYLQLFVDEKQFVKKILKY